MSDGEVCSGSALSCCHPPVPFTFFNLFMLYFIKTFQVQLLFVQVRFFSEVMDEAVAGGPHDS